MVSIRKSALGIGFALVLLASFLIRASAAVTSSSFFYSIGKYYYSIVVNPSDKITSYSYELCNGSSGSASPNVITSGYTLPGMAAPFKWVTTVWNSNGTITEYSGECGSPKPANFYKDSFTDEESGFAALTLPKNGGIYYAAGTCAEKCTLSPSIPMASKDSLPSDATSTLYVRLTRDGGSYTACFDLGSLTNQVIYRYVGGVWVSQPATVGGGKVCTNANGDGAFALGGS